MQEYKGKEVTKFYWIILYLVGVSRNEYNESGKGVYSLHITPFLEVSFSPLGTRGGCEKTV